jgi:hypothetical protein
VGVDRAGGGLKSAQPVLKLSAKRTNLFTLLSPDLFPER